MKKFGLFVVQAGFVFSVCGISTYDNEFGSQSAALRTSTVGASASQRCNKCRNVVDFCDGIDNDCDGMVDEDDPNIGRRCVLMLEGMPRQGSLECTYTVAGAFLTCQIDCQPYETCSDGIDNNCDGLIDNAYPPPPCATDKDCSCFDHECSYFRCVEGVCLAYGQDEDGDGAVACGDNKDCNDQDSTVYPGAFELCDKKDNDCDGLIDENCASRLVVSLAADSPAGYTIQGVHTAVLNFNLSAAKDPVVIYAITVGVYATCGSSLQPIPVIEDRHTGKIVNYPLTIDGGQIRALAVYVNTTGCQPGSTLKAVVGSITTWPRAEIIGLPLAGNLLKF